MKKILLFLILGVSLPAFSQSINDFQYVIVPIKYDFLKENDKFRLNTLTKLLLQKYGLKAYLNTETLPEEAGSDRCSFLYASVDEQNGMLVSKLKVVLKDCQDKVIYETDFGSSREKEYDVAYNQALRAAFQSFDKLHYKYNGAQPTGKSTETISKPVEVKVAPEVKLSLGQLYAQPINNGFQLLNTEPKVIYKIYNTSLKDYYIASKGEQQGVFFAKDNGWFFEYYQNDKLISEKVVVKF